MTQPKLGWRNVKIINMVIRRKTSKNEDEGVIHRNITEYEKNNIW